jgi:hypothetical protein
MFHLGAFLGGKLIATFPNEVQYYKILYEYAMAFAEDTGAFVEVKLFDFKTYQEIMEEIKENSK